MSTKKPVSEALTDALETVYPDSVYPETYVGTATEYVVWNYSVINEVWAESVPQAARYLVQVHLYSPRGKDPTAAILALEQALSAAGFTWPARTDASDKEGQHHVLECEYCDGGGYYGHT